MPEIVLQMVSLIFQGIKGFVFDLPSCPAAFDQIHDVVPGDGDIGYPTVTVGRLISLELRIFKVVDVVGIFCSVERDIIEPFINMPFLFHILDLKPMCLAHFPEIREPLIEEYMIIGLGNEDEGHAGLFEFIDERLFGIQSVSNDNDPEFGMCGTDLMNNPFPCIDFAVLFGASIEILYCFGCQRKDLFDPRADNGGGNHLMIICRGFVADFSEATVAGNSI